MRFKMNYINDLILDDCTGIIEVCFCLFLRKGDPGAQQQDQNNFQDNFHDREILPKLSKIEIAPFWQSILV
jgi:hypothetical protein